MSTSSSDDSARLPSFVSPDARQQLVTEPLSTKRERMESNRSRFGDQRFFPRVIRSAPVVARQKHRVAPHAHAIIFHTPPNTPNSPSPVEFEKSDSAYCRTDHECVSVPIESEHYDISKKATYFEQAFIVTSKLGEGSFGEVFQAKSREDSKEYAVKRAIEPYRSSSDRALKLREVQKHEELTPHPNLIYFYRAWEEKGRLYIQTELCVKSLADLCIYDAPPINEIWDIFYDVINATDYLHSKDLIHMDIKPENIFMTKDKVCKLGDFGLMFDLKHDHIATVEDGDSKYLAPEVLNNPPTQAADIFSIGMSILEVSTNLDLPTTGEHWHALRSRRVPERFLTMLDADMRRLVLWMLDPIPESRPTTQALIADPAVHWPFTWRSTKADIAQRVCYSKMSLASSHFNFLSRWASLLWRMAAVPLQKLAELFAHARRKRVRREFVDETRTPDLKRQRMFETSPVDYDSSYSDEEDTRHKMASARCLSNEISDQLYYNVMHPSLSPFREQDEQRTRAEKQRLREERSMSPNSFVSPSSPLFVHDGGAASAPMIGIGRRRPTGTTATRPPAASRLSSAHKPPLSARLRLDSDSDGEAVDEMSKRKHVSLIGTPMSSSLSLSTRQFRRSALRSLDSPRARKLDFSVLDQVQEPANQETELEEATCRTPSPSQQRHRMAALAAGDA